ncbi:MAG: DUF1285 domain-containing protein [Pseudomonadales bacterium]|nr:DUF1285 domain-containing protein [Pseudomonadales bacterium]NIX09013.1 DUF1285 domain-containing protein [Pseudomonadales bacterium]
MTDPTYLFEAIVAAQQDRRLPPVANWDPERVGRIDIRIAADGTWYHEGEPIRRQKMVDLFSTVLRRDPDGYCLVTPVQKLIITVEDAPFVAVDFETRGEGTAQDVVFVTNTGDAVVADGAHPVRVADHAGAPRPYVMVRDGLDALIARPVFYRLVELAAEEGGELCLYSRGERFVLGQTS